MGKTNGNNMNNQSESFFVNKSAKNKFSALYTNDTDDDTIYKPPIKTLNQNTNNDFKNNDFKNNDFKNNDFIEVKRNSNYNNKKNIKIISLTHKKPNNRYVEKNTLDDFIDQSTTDLITTEKSNTSNTDLTITEQLNTELDNSINIILPSVWNLYEHNSDSKNWKIDSYNNIYKITNASNLWKFLNNFYRIDFKTYDFFLMKEDVLPIWEHPKNRDGSICSIRTDINNGSDAVCLIMLHMVTNKLYTDGSDDINGISCSVRNNWMVIKIWCGFKEDKLTGILQNGLLSKLNNLTFKHISTIPQY